MATQVIKKNGEKQPFDAEKIRKAIGLACDEGGVAEEKKNQVIEQVLAQALSLADAKEEIATSELKEKILTELDAVEPAASAAWRKHDQERKGAQA